MKTTRFFFLLASIIIFSQQLFSQTPYSINYQAVVRDSSGSPLINQPMAIKISIYKDTLQQQMTVYSEIHQVTTNQFGLFNVKIGEGVPTLGTFDDIDWMYSNHGVKIEVDQNNTGNYQLLGNMLFSSVPYALMSKRTGILQSDDMTAIASRKLETFPLNTTAELATMNVFAQPNIYDPYLQHLDGLAIVNNENRPGDVSLTLSSRSNYTWNNIYKMSTVVLNVVASGNDRADFTIQNEYAGPNLVHETFRIKYNGNVGIGSQDPREKLHVSNGNVYIDQIGKGVIMKSPNGSCWLYTPDNYGNLHGQSIPCP